MGQSPQLPPSQSVEPADALRTPALDRRSFMQTLASIVTAGNQIVALSKAAGVGGAVAEAALAPDFERVVVEAVSKFFNAESALRKTIRPLDFYHSSIKVVAGLIEFNGDLPHIDAKRAQREVNAHYFKEKIKVDQLLKDREENLAILHQHRDVLVQLIEAHRPGSQFNLARLSAVLGEENAGLNAAQVARLAREESREIIHLSVENLFNVGKAAISQPTAYTAPDGRRVYRHVDGSFALEPDPRWDEKLLAPKKSAPSLDGPTLDKIAQSFSPEMYAYATMPPSRYSLAVELPALTREFYRIVIKKVHEDLENAKLPLELHLQLGAAQVEHILSPAAEKGDAYLRIIESHGRAITYQDIERNRDLLLYQNPRAAVAYEMTAFRMQFIDFEQLQERISFLGMRFFTNAVNGAWGGPFAKNKERQLVHDVFAQSVIELTRERRLFFLNYPVNDLKHFKAIASVYSQTTQFAGMVLDIAARMGKKQIDLNAYFASCLGINGPRDRD